MPRVERAAAWFHSHGKDWQYQGSIQKAYRAANWALWMSMNVGRHPLARKNVISSLARLWAWQIWRRSFRRPVVVVTGVGTRIICPPWSALAEALVAVGVPEVEHMLFAVDLVRPDDIVIDVGANLGVYAIACAIRGAHTIAVEPDENALEILKANARLNQVEDRVFIVSAAASDHAGEALFTVGLDIANHIVDGRTHEEQSRVVRVVRLDDLEELRSVRPRKPMLLKVDTEGFDLNVLRGADALIKEFKPALIAEIWDGGLPLREWLNERGYTAFSYDWRRRQLLDLPESFRGQGNLIAIHTDLLPAVRVRVRESSRRGVSRPHVVWGSMPSAKSKSRRGRHVRSS